MKMHGIYRPQPEISMVGQDQEIITEKFLVTPSGEELFIYVSTFNSYEVDSNTHLSFIWSY